jgi:hypothetical protein
MFTVLLSPDESGTHLTPDMRKIAEYSAQGTGIAVVLVEVIHARRLSPHEIERRGLIAALPAADIKEGFDLARSIIERQPPANVSCRSRSRNR